MARKNIIDIAEGESKRRSAVNSDERQLKVGLNPITESPPRIGGTALSNAPGLHTDAITKVGWTQETNAGSPSKKVPGSACKRKVRLLPVSNSLSAHRSSLALFSASSTPTKLDRDFSSRIRATPARSAKKPLTYRDVSPASSEASVASGNEISIFCDDASEASLSSDVNHDQDIDAPILWPRSRIQALSPIKKTDGALPESVPPRKKKGLHRVTTKQLDILAELADLDLSDSEDSDRENREPTRNAIPATGSPAKIPPRANTPSRTVQTPPASPTKSRLNSPSKHKFRVPTPPGRPSLDAFWDAEEINGWNDAHSPRKPILSPTKQRFFDTAAPVILDLAAVEPPGTPSSPSKRGCASPDKQRNDGAGSCSPRKTKAEIAARRDFDARKEGLAATFLAELDERITDGEVGRRTAATGGVRVVWSRTLNSTAGRASWKKETVRSASNSSTTSSGSNSSSSSIRADCTTAVDAASDDGTSPDSSSSASSTSSPQKRKTEIRHHATIELATKVLTDERRLLNTLAHEFCHLATYVISGVKTNPHGAVFRSWGAKCDAAFGARGVRVTTRHDYEIDWRYVWACVGRDEVAVSGSSRQDTTAGPVEGGDDDDGSLDVARALFSGPGGCSATYGRHSRSIDVERARCGKCRGRLAQVKPVPRAAAHRDEIDVGSARHRQGQAKGTDKGAVTGFAAFVKLHFADTKRELGPGLKHAAVMAELGRRWREEKARSAAALADIAETGGLEGGDVQREPAGSKQDAVELDLVRGLEVVVIDE